jgi:D-alanine-D-alanine ligase
MNNLSSVFRNIFRKQARSTLRILVLVDPCTVFEDDPDFEHIQDLDTASMEHHIVAGLRGLKHQVEVLAFHSDTRQTLAQIQNARADVVFNLVELVDGDRRKSMQVPAVLDLLRIPYTGCAAVGTSLSLDKVVSKQILSDQGLSVPRFATWPVGAAACSRKLRFPVIVKPRYGGGSEGISLASIVHEPRQLAKRANYIHNRLQQSAICEEYIAGRELSVGIFGNGKPLLVLPTRETVFDTAGEGGPAIATDRVKSSRTYRERWKISYQKANLTADLQSAVSTLAHEAYLHLELTGYARIDMRLDPQRGPVFLEANANPDLNPRVFGVMASWVGISYEQLLTGIIELALRR